MIKHALVIASLLGVCTPCAQANTQVALYSGRTIVSLGAYADGAYIQFTPALSGVEGCTTQDHLWINLTSQADGKAMYATVLAAHLAGQKLAFGVAGCSSGGAPLVYRVDIVP